jgi:hypothetical protein
LLSSAPERITSRLEAQAEYHPPDNSPKLVAAVVDVETTGINPHSDRIIELGICLFEYDRQNGRIYRVLGSWEWFEDPGFSIPPGFFHDGHRAASDCRATLHALAQPLPTTGRLALQALLEQARLPRWRIWARDAAIEKKDVLKARGYAWSPGEFGRPKCWYRDVSDADKAAEVAWLREEVMGPNQAVWALCITARDRYSDRCWGWGQPLSTALKGAGVGQ